MSTEIGLSSADAMAPVERSSLSETSRAEPAVSASGTGFKPSLRSVVRHCPSACVWLMTRLIVERLAPGFAMS